MIRQLGDPSFEAREKALTELQSRGVPAVALLRQAVDNPIRRSAIACGDCLEFIEKDKSASLSPATIHLVALRKPAGALEVLDPVHTLCGK